MKVSMIVALAVAALPLMPTTPALAESSAPAAEMQQMSGSMMHAYSATEAQAAIAAGKPVLLWFHKMGCPTCAAQQPTLDSYLKQHDGLMAYKVNFAEDKAANESYGVGMQSTLIVFREGKEITRSTGETDAAKLQMLLGQLNG